MNYPLRLQTHTGYSICSLRSLSEKREYREIWSFADAIKDFKIAQNNPSKTPPAYNMLYNKNRNKKKGCSPQNRCVYCFIEYNSCRRVLILTSLSMNTLRQKIKVVQAWAGLIFAGADGNYHYHAGAFSSSVFFSFFLLLLLVMLLFSFWLWLHLCTL